MTQLPQVYSSWFLNVNGYPLTLAGTTRDFPVELRDGFDKNEEIAEAVF